MNIIDVYNLGMALMFLNGTAMSGQKDFSSHLGSVFLGSIRSSARYRFFAIRDEFPGLYPVAEDGRSILGELYEMSDQVLCESLLPAEPKELKLGQIELENGQEVYAMILHPDRLVAGEKIVDISEFGSFRTYQTFLQDNARITSLLGRDDVETLFGARPAELL